MVKLKRWSVALFYHLSKRFPQIKCAKIIKRRKYLWINSRINQKKRKGQKYRKANDIGDAVPTGVDWPQGDTLLLHLQKREGPFFISHPRIFRRKMCQYVTVSPFRSVIHKIDTPSRIVPPYHIYWHMGTWQEHPVCTLASPPLLKRLSVKPTLPKMHTCFSHLRNPTQHLRVVF